MITDAAANPAVPDSSARVFARALQKATSDVKGITGLLLALGGAVAAYVALKSALPAQSYAAEASVAIFGLAFYFLYVHPEWREERKRHRLDVEGVRGHVSDPSYFRLSPYERDDKDRFTRAAGMIEAAKGLSRLKALKQLPIPLACSGSRYRRRSLPLPTRSSNKGCVAAIAHSRFWPKAENRCAYISSGHWGCCGRDMLAVSLSAFEPHEAAVVDSRVMLLKSHTKGLPIMVN